MNFDLNTILENVRQQAIKDNNSTQEFKNWIANEQKKIDDPKFKSYAIIAEMISIN